MRKNLHNIRMQSPAFILTLLIGFTTMLKANTYIVTNTRNDGKGSLKLAINQANAHAGKDKIIFNFTQVESAHVIRLGNEWLNVSDDLVIDGFEGNTYFNNSIDRLALESRLVLEKAARSCARSMHPGNRNATKVR